MAGEFPPLRLSDPIELAPMPDIYEDILGIRAVQAHRELITREANSARVYDDLRRAKALEEERASLPISTRAADFVRSRLDSDSLCSQEVRFTREAKAAGNGQVMADFFSGESRGLHRRRSRELKTAAYRLASLDAEHKEKFTEYVKTSHPDFFVSQSDAAAIEGESWLDWVTAVDDENVLHQGALLELLEWHTDTIDKHQNDKRVQDVIARQRDNFKRTIASGIEEGWLHERAKDAIDAVDGVTVYVGDIADPAFQDNTRGYYCLGTDHLVLKQGLTAGETLKVLKDPLFIPHELNHAVIENQDAMNGLHNRWLYEALTAHITAAQIHGAPDVLNPYERYGGEALHYSHERMALSLAVEGPGRKAQVDPALATRAYSGGEAEMVEFSNAIDEAWGVENMLGRVSARIVKVEKDLRQLKPDDGTSHIQMLAMDQLVDELLCTTRVQRTIIL